MGHLVRYFNKIRQPIAHINHPYLRIGLGVFRNVSTYPAGGDRGWTSGRIWNRKEMLELVVDDFDDGPVGGVEQVGIGDP